MTDQSEAITSFVVAGPGTGQMLALGGTLHAFKLTGADTGGRFALMEATLQPHTLVMPHVHTNEDELTYVLEGEGGIRVGDRDITCLPGSTIFIPRGTPHAVWNPTDTPGRAITLFSPAGIERYFHEMAEIMGQSGPPDGARLGALGQRYGIRPLMEWIPELSARYGVRLG
jgi:quercetin dioxygenase-like cupin family protein